MNLKSLPIIAALALSPVAANATCYPLNFSGMGGQLELGMTEYQAGVALGNYRASSVGVETCGSSLKSGEWTCKIEEWGSSCQGGMLVWFEEFKGVWLVAGWRPEAPTGY